MPRLLPDLSGAQAEYENRFTVRELYDATVLLPRAMAVLASNRRHQHLDGRAIERIMLTVTEVNGCPACSWAHSRMALRQGMTGAEISSLLRGSGALVPPEEATGVAFAQHYADSRGRPDGEAYDTVMRAYGPDRARVVLAAAQAITVGNGFGIPLSAFRSRQAGTPWTGSSLGYEVQTLVGGALVLPVALVHGVLRWAAGAPAARFAST